MLVMFCVSVYHRLDAECPKFVQLAGSFFEWGPYPVQPISHSYVNLYVSRNVCARSSAPLRDSLSGARFFLGLAGWFCRAWLDFFLQFQEILDQELDQLLSPENGLQTDSETWTQKLVQKLDQKVGPCEFCIGAPQWASFLC